LTSNISSAINQKITAGGQNEPSKEGLNEKTTYDFSFGHSALFYF
jgi:hypothetical protein